MMNLIINSILSLSLAMLIFLIISSIGYLILFFASLPDIFFRYKEKSITHKNYFLISSHLPPVTIIICAYNEESNIEATILSVLENDYPNKHILLINDGSTDQTLTRLINQFKLQKITPFVQEKIKTNGKITGYYISKLHPNLIVIDKEHSDKSDSLNVGLNACRTPLFMTLDADTLIESDTITRVVFPLLSQPHTVALGSGIYVLNGCELKNNRITATKISLKPLPALQTCEYLRSFLFGRSGWNKFGGALCYAGACALFEYQAIIDIGGFEVGNPAQDFEIITHLQAIRYQRKYPYTVSYTPAAIAWTDVPNTLKDYWHQRTTWQYYSLHSIFKHKAILFNPQYGIEGFITFPFYLFCELFGAIVELTAYLLAIICWLLGILNYQWAILFFVLCWGFVTFLTMANTLINFATFNEYKRLRDVIWILIYSVVEQFGFRQFSALCRSIATFKFFISRFKKRNL